MKNFIIILIITVTNLSAFEIGDKVGLKIGAVFCISKTNTEIVSYAALMQNMFNQNSSPMPKNIVDLFSNKKCFVITDSEFELSNTNAWTIKDKKNFNVPEIKEYYTSYDCLKIENSGLVAWIIAHKNGSKSDRLFMKKNRK
ncbi:MAG: hypothetical protein U9N59_15930 [Campylobacterota bacterium]|nr:hypothetical protein [Campylobacterota bacterium]